MEKLPVVNVNLSTGATGAILAGTDGTSALICSGVAVAGQFALNDVLGPFYSLADAEAKGINEAYDTTNTCVAYKHIFDFYEEAGEGAELYVMVVAKTVTLAQMLDKDLNYSPKVVEATAGKVRSLSVARTPQNNYAAVYTDQFDNDIWAAIAEGKQLRVDQFEKGVPLLIIIEGRDFQGTASAAKNLSDAANGDAEFVAVMIGQDAAYSAANAHAAKYAAVGHLLGRMASIQVQRNIGRVLDGERLGIALPGLSNGQAIKTAANVVNFTNTQLDTLTGFHYIFFRTFSGRTGAYYNNDYCACPTARKYSRISKCRPIDKVVRIANATYTNNLLDDLDLTEAGKLDAAVIKNFQSSIERDVIEKMITTATGVKELSQFRAIADPNQPVQQLNSVKVKLEAIPKGMADTIDVTIQYVTSFQ